MKIRQNVRHWAAKQALTIPVVGEYVSDRLVNLHTSVFLDRAVEGRADERRDYLDALFEATIDTYVDALDEGYTEAQAREITHIQANFAFYNHGDRYAGFFDTYGIAIDDPLGEFSPEEGLPSAPSTPERLEEPEHPYAEGGFADDVYVETADGELVVGGGEEPDEVDVEAAPGVDDERIEEEPPSEG